MEIKEFGEAVIELCGGKDNIVTVANCMTRLRISLKDIKKADVEKLEDLPKVSGVVVSDTLQVIVGPRAKKIALEINDMFSFEGESLERGGTSEKKGLKKALKSIANIFVPILPGLIAAGTIMGINNIIVNSANLEAVKLGMEGAGGLSAGQVLLQEKGLLNLTVILGMVGSSLFGFLSIYTGIFSAKEFRATPVLGGLLGAITIAPQLNQIGVQPGKGGLIGVIFAVYILSHVEKRIRKIIPDVLDIVVTPTLSLVLMVLILIFGIMPAAGLISDAIIGGLQGILREGGMLAGFTLASLFPTLISLGLHHGLAPIHMELINSTGTTPLFAMQIMSNAGMVGAAVAVLVMTKNKKVKEIAKGAIPTSILAVGEPTIFGVNIPAGFPFITGSVGAGFGGIMIVLLGVETTAYGAAGLSALPMVANGMYLQYIGSWLVGASAAFILTLIVGKARKYS